MASRKLVRIWTDTLLLRLFSGLSQKRREIEIKMLCICQETEKIPHNILERKVDLAVRGERMAQQKL